MSMCTYVNVYLNTVTQYYVFSSTDFSISCKVKSSITKVHKDTTSIFPPFYYLLQNI